MHHMDELFCPITYYSTASYHQQRCLKAPPPPPLPRPHSLLLGTPEEPCHKPEKCQANALVN